jgi:hypothetical protein
VTLGKSPHDVSAEEARPAEDGDKGIDIRRSLFPHCKARARKTALRCRIAYQAWLPLERIRPPYVTQQKWEETFAWPPDGRPPYPSLAHRMVRAVITYLVVGLTVAVLLQAFTPFPVLSWLGNKARILVGI